MCTRKLFLTIVMVTFVSSVSVSAQSIVLEQVQPSEKNPKCNSACCEQNHVQSRHGGMGPQKFSLIGRWMSTASQPGPLSQGDATIVTWSVVPDGTIVNGAAPSDLVARFDYGFEDPNAGTRDITNRIWFGVMAKALERWGELSGLILIYEPNDDGEPFSGANPGVLGVRGDIRIGGHELLPGQGGFSGFPDFSDMRLTTREDALLIWRGQAPEYRGFRGLVAHESGHGLGFLHTVSDSHFVMESSGFGVPDGPQLDDLLAAQRHYGDRHEQANNLAGNDSFSNAISLGSLKDGESVSIGSDGKIGVQFGFDARDFASVDGGSDKDFFEVVLDEQFNLQIALRNVGDTYNLSGSPFDPKTLNDLALTVFDSNRAQLLHLDNAPQFEGIINFVAGPGSIFLRATGSIDQVQLYELSVSATEFPVVVPVSYSISSGMLESGDITDVTQSDDSFFQARITAPATEMNVNFAAYTTNLTPTKMSVTLEGFVETTGLTQNILLLNWNTLQYEQIGSTNAPTTDTVELFSVPGDVTRFVNDSSGLIVIGAEFEQSGTVVGYPWKVNIDQLVLTNQ